MRLPNKRNRPGKHRLYSSEAPLPYFFMACCCQPAKVLQSIAQASCLRFFKCIFFPMEWEGRSFHGLVKIFKLRFCFCRKIMPAYAAGCALERAQAALAGGRNGGLDAQSCVPAPAPRQLLRRMDSRLPGLPLQHFSDGNAFRKALHCRIPLLPGIARFPEMRKTVLPGFGALRFLGGLFWKNVLK